MAKAKIATVVLIDGVFTFKWANGETTQFDTHETPDEMDERAKFHGYEQKLRDSYAGAKSVAEAMERHAVVADGLMRGQWSQKGGTNIVLLALVRMGEAEGKEAEEIMAKWDALDDDARKKVAKNKAVRKVVKEIELERLAGADDDAGLDDIFE